MSIKIIYTQLLVLFAFSITLNANSLSVDYDNERDEFEILMSRIRRDITSNPSIDNSLKLFNRYEGTFSDIDYSSTQRTLWPPILHLERTLDFVSAYINPDSKYFQDDDLFVDIEKSLSYWHERNPWCHNWWYNQIAEPQMLGKILIQMRGGKKRLSKELEARILERMANDGGDPAKWTGANKTDIALHWIYRSCLQRNHEELRYAIVQVYSPVGYTTKEGFQYDNCYFQHGKQLYIGGYGEEILKGVTQVALYTQGTSYELPADKLDIISRYIRQTYYSTIRRGYMAYEVLGRSISRPDALNRTGSASLAKRMIILDKRNENEYNDIIKRLSGDDRFIRPMHTHYHIGDYTLHIRPHYTFGVRFSSVRTIRCEYGNKENLKAYFLSDGCTDMTRHGGEYYNVFPLWNWAQIPGITAPQLETIPLHSKEWETYGNSTFAGGVSDSIYGVSTYVYKDTCRNIRTEANKAWLFFDNEIVCLGSNISSKSEFPVYTTVNQCIADTTGVIISDDGRKYRLLSSGTSSGSLKWVVHDGVGYYFPSKARVISGIENKEGTWNDINKSYDKKISKKVFSLCIDHGLYPQGQTYAYVVVPGIDTVDKMKNYHKKSPVRILSNTEKLQAVYHENLDVLQVVFYTSGELSYKGCNVKTDKPCALIVKNIKSGSPVMHVADPGQTMKKIRIRIKFDKDRERIIDFMPENEIQAGATRKYELSNL